MWYNGDTNMGIVGDALWESRRWFLEISQQMRHIKRGEARWVLVQRYLDNVVAADRKMIAKVFHALKWTKRSRSGRSKRWLRRDRCRRQKSRV